MKFAIMMRAMDQDSGFRSIVEGLVENMLRVDQENSYLLLYRTDKWFGRFAAAPNVKELLLPPSQKLIWDQWQVPRAARREGADIIFNPKFSVPLVSHCPVAMGLQEPAWFVWPEHYEWFDRTYMRLMLPLYVRRAAVIFPNSQFILDESRKFLPLPAEKVAVTHTAAKPYIARVTDPARLEAFRQEYQLPQRYILNVTRVDHPGVEGSRSFHPGKNPETTLRAFLELRHEIPHHLVFAGRRVKEYFEHLGFRESDFERVHFLGFVKHDEMASLYSLAEVFVIPSHYEGCPSTALEALAAGTPVVGSTQGGVPEIVGDVALLADPQDPAAFARHIRAILADPQLAERLRNRGPAQAAKFSWERSARTTIQGLVNAVLRSRPRAASPGQRAALPGGKAAPRQRHHSGRA